MGGFKSSLTSQQIEEKLLNEEFVNIPIQLTQTDATAEEDIMNIFNESGGFENVINRLTSGAKPIMLASAEQDGMKASLCVYPTVNMYYMGPSEYQLTLFYISPDSGYLYMIAVARQSGGFNFSRTQANAG